MSCKITSSNFIFCIPFSFPDLFPYLSDCTNAWLSYRCIDCETSLMEFVTIWFSKSHLNFPNIAPYSGRFSLASNDWRTAPALHWSQVYTDKSWLSHWHRSILSCPCIRSNFCASIWIGQSSQNRNTSGSIKRYPHIHWVSLPYECFQRFSWLKISLTH